MTGGKLSKPRVTRNNKKPSCR